MPKLINLLHPHEINKIDTVNKFLIFSKNVFRIIEKKGCTQKINGILIPVRWSKIKKSWVVDRGTALQRDKEGIDLNNINKYFNRSDCIYSAIVSVLNLFSSNNKINVIANEFNLHKNEKKFIALEYVEKDNDDFSLYVLGLYLRHNKNREKVLNTYDHYSSCLDDSFFNQKFLSLNIDKVYTAEKIFFKTNYTKVYSEFIDFLKEKTYIENKSFDDIKNNNLSKEITTNLNTVRQILNNEIEIKQSNKKCIIKLLLSIYLGEFLKHKLSSDSVEGFILFDSALNRQLKFVGNNILKRKTNFKKILKEEDISYNKVCLLPKAF